MATTRLATTGIAASLQTFVRNATDDEIQVWFSDGVAVLTGTTTSATRRTAIEDLVAAHDGVLRIENRIEVTPEPPLLPSPRGRSDREVRGAPRPMARTCGLW